MTSSGSHALKWRYVKDSGGIEGDDCAWVDFVQWTGLSPVQDPNNWDTITYKYDTSGRRVEKNVEGYKTRYVYDGGNVIAEYDGNNNLTRKYIHGARIDEMVCMIDVADSNAVYYYHYDGSGSVVALSNSSGNSCQSYEYSAFGQVAASDPNFIANPYMFTGRRFDYETGLYYYRARYYNPYIGRFLQTDPIGYGDGINWYTYCRNNPLRYVDHMGNHVTDLSGPYWNQPELPKLGTDWNLQDYFEWYKLPRPYEQVDLRDTGMFDDLVNSRQVSTVVSKWETDIMANAVEQYLLNVQNAEKGYISNEEIGFSVTITNSEKLDFGSFSHFWQAINGRNELFILGRTTLTMHVEGTFHDDGTFEFVFYYSIDDDFKDPLLVWDFIDKPALQGLLETGSPYAIGTSWTEIEEGIISYGP